MSKRTLKQTRYTPSPSMDFWMVIFLVVLMIGTCFLLIYLQSPVSLGHEMGMI